MAEVVQNGSEARQAAKLGKLAERINAEYKASVAAKVSALEHAMEAGRLLKEVKDSLLHTEWGPWLAANFEASDRTARSYIQLYKRREDLIAQNGNGVATMSLRDALKALAAPYEPYGEPIPGVESPTPEQEKRQRAKAAKEQRLLRKAEFALRTGNLDPPADLTTWEANKWGDAVYEAQSGRKAHLETLLDVLAHQLLILSHLADPEKVGRYLAVPTNNLEVNEDRAAILEQLRDALPWLSAVLAAAEQERERMQSPE